MGFSPLPLVSCWVVPAIPLSRLTIFHHHLFFLHSSGKCFSGLYVLLVVGTSPFTHSVPSSRNTLRFTSRNTSTKARLMYCSGVCSSPNLSVNAVIAQTVVRRGSNAGIDRIVGYRL